MQTLQTETPDAVLVTSDQTFDEDVLHSDKPVLVDFWAGWCGPCRMVAPVLEEIGRELSGRAKIAKLNVDENPSTAAHYGIASLPTMLVFKNGRVVDQIIGAAAKRTIATKFAAHLN
jgi:thioredoxin 1